MALRKAPVHSGSHTMAADDSIQYALCCTYEKELRAKYTNIRLERHHLDRTGGSMDISCLLYEPGDNRTKHINDIHHLITIREQTPDPNEHSLQTLISHIYFQTDHILILRRIPGHDFKWELLYLDYHDPTSYQQLQQTTKETIRHRTPIVL